MRVAVVYVPSGRAEALAGLSASLAAAFEAAGHRAEILDPGQAIARLAAFDYVAFVDRLEEDRPRLMQVLGLPDPGPLTRENTRELVDSMLEPAREVEVTPEAERELARLTELDRIVYRLARQHYG